MTRASLWLLGFTCHFWRNRRYLIFLVLIVPVVTAAAVKLMASPDWAEGMELE